MKKLRALISSHEDWLMRRILRYARERDYTKYTSTLEEAWRLSVSGLSESLLGAIQADSPDLELGPDEKFAQDPAARFGIIEARQHRERGIELGMFLGLMKYYRQCYKDLIEEQGELEPADARRFLHVVERFFDRVEIGFCVEWASLSEQSKLDELRAANRRITNEKDKYLTIFESEGHPVILLDDRDRVENMNLAAATLFADRSVPGSQYYFPPSEPRAAEERTPVALLLPWLVHDLSTFRRGARQERSLEREVTGERGSRFYAVKLSRLLDITGRRTGTVIRLENITDRKRLEIELEKLATTDALTGAWNRYYFWQLAKREIGRARRYGHALSVLLLDIDFFKLINDSHGHHAGDMVLSGLAGCCLEMLRDSDIFGRLGGEEFGVLLTETGADDAAAVAERMRLTLSSLAVEVGDVVVHFTVSIGVTTLGAEDEQVEDLLQRADRALYQAKGSGRNRTATVRSCSTAH